jgi:D-glycero-alpha-D-manno-heptose-7-phosphate kinase
VVVRAPLRVALGGGGTDLPAYYREHGGLVVSTAIDKYIQIVVATPFQRSSDPAYRLKHLEWEEAERPPEVRHPILREALVHHWRGGPIELASVSDVLPGTGLGSSGAYSVAAVAALSDEMPSPGDLAEAACHLEIDLLGRSIGKQDAYAAAFGGLRAYSFRPDDSVEARELAVSDEVRRALREDFLLFFTGQERSASDILGAGQVEHVLHSLKELAVEMCHVLQKGALDRMSELMDAHWEVKRERAPGTVTPEMDELRERARRRGSCGVISLGAGGGGFLLVYSPEPERTRAAMEGAPELRFGLDERGCVRL